MYVEAVEGEYEGEYMGAVDGRYESEHVGAMESAFVGALEGEYEGPVGEFEGENVGALEGDFVGALEGEYEGEYEGPEGEYEGENVGASMKDRRVNMRARMWGQWRVKSWGIWRVNMRASRWGLWMVNMKDPWVNMRVSMWELLKLWCLMGTPRDQNIPPNYIQTIYVVYLKNKIRRPRKRIIYSRGDNNRSNRIAVECFRSDAPNRPDSCWEFWILE